MTPKEFEARVLPLVEEFLAGFLRDRRPSAESASALRDVFGQ